MSITSRPPNESRFSSGSAPGNRDRGPCPGDHLRHQHHRQGSARFCRAVFSTSPRSTSAVSIHPHRLLITARDPGAGGAGLARGTEDDREVISGVIGCGTQVDSAECVPSPASVAVGLAPYPTIAFLISEGLYSAAGITRATGRTASRLAAMAVVTLRRKKLFDHNSSGRLPLDEVRRLAWWRIRRRSGMARSEPVSITEIDQLDIVVAAATTPKSENGGAWMIPMTSGVQGHSRLMTP